MDKGGRGANTGSSCSQVNSQCHGSEGPVKPKNPDRVMNHPIVHAIYWDDYFSQRPGISAVTLMNQFFSEILSGRFMNGLKQYGVEEARFYSKSLVVPSPDPLPDTLTSQYIQEHLIQWIRDEKLPAPEPNETNRLYVIFTPNDTVFEGADGICVGGYHSCGHVGNSSGNANLFWAAIQEWHHDPKNLPASDSDFVNSCSWLVSHEMVEAFTSRDGYGYQNAEGCEIGDICECAEGDEHNKTPIIKAQVGRWFVETYWDDVNKSCYPLHIVPRAVPPKPESGYDLERKGGGKASSGGRQRS